VPVSSTPLPISRQTTRRRPLHAMNIKKERFRLMDFNEFKSGPARGIFAGLGGEWPEVLNRSEPCVSITNRPKIRRRWAEFSDVLTSMLVSARINVSAGEYAEKTAELLSETEDRSSSSSFERADFDLLVLGTIAGFAGEIALWELIQMSLYERSAARAEMAP
jgi:hypothetical protein